MAVYETIFITVPSDAPGTLDAIVDKAKGIIETGKGKILSVDNWGTRPMEYAVGKHEKGTYVCLTYEGDRPVTIELEKYFKLTEGVLRIMTVNASNRRPRGKGDVSPAEKKLDAASSQTTTAGGTEMQGGTEEKHE